MRYYKENVGSPFSSVATDIFVSSIRWRIRVSSCLFLLLRARRESIDRPVSVDDDDAGADIDAGADGNGNDEDDDDDDGDDWLVMLLIV